MNSANRRHNKAMKELGETRVLVEYLLFHRLSLENIANFSDSMVKAAILWSKEKGRA